jgi:hypothetical protein
VDFVQWLKTPEVTRDSWLRLTLRALVLPAIDYISAAMTITQVFGVRLAVLALATPAFVLFDDAQQRIFFSNRRVDPSAEGSPDHQ